MALYFRVADHREVSAAEALDARGVLRHGYGQRVPAHLRDGASRFSDAQQHRPGWRIADNDPGRAIRDAAYRDWEERTTSAWKTKAQRDAEKLCPDCSGEGTDANGDDCERCGGLGEIDDDDNGNGNGDKPQGQRVRPVTADHRSVDQMAHDHQQRMHDEYLAYEKRLTAAWRAKG